jgi:hypothetical protein
LKIYRYNLSKGGNSDEKKLIGAVFICSDRVHGGVTIFEEIVDANSDVSFAGGRIGVIGFYITFVVNNMNITLYKGLTETSVSPFAISFN